MATMTTSIDGLIKATTDARRVRRTPLPGGLLATVRWLVIGRDRRLWGGAPNGGRRCAGTPVTSDVCGVPTAVRPCPGETFALGRRLGRSLGHLLDTMTSFGERGVGFSTAAGIHDTTTSGGRLMFHGSLVVCPSL